MKPQTLLFGVLLFSCSGNNNMPLSLDEIEYQKFATEAEQRVNSRPLQPNAGISVYKESGLPEFIYGIDGGSKVKSLADLDEFYDKVILQKYSKNDYQDVLKIKFISYAVSAFNLTQMENVEATHHLVKYSRELAMNNRDFDFELSYKCISHVKGLIGEEEFNAMVKKMIFNIRFGKERMEKSLIESKNKNSETDKYLAKRLDLIIQNMNQFQSDFGALVVK